MYVQTYVRDSLCEPLALLLTTLPLCMFACSDPDFQLPGKTIGMYHSSNVLCTLLGGPLPEQELRFFSVYLQTVIAVVSYVAKVPDGNNLHDSYSITIVLYSLDFSNLSVPSYRPDPTGILVSSRRLHCAQLLQSSCGSRTQIFPLSSNNPDISGCDLVVISPSMVVVYVHH